VLPIRRRRSAFFLPASFVVRWTARILDNHFPCAGEMLQSPLRWRTPIESQTGHISARTPETMPRPRPVAIPNPIPFDYWSCASLRLFPFFRLDLLSGTARRLSLREHGRCGHLFSYLPFRLAASVPCRRSAAPYRATLTAAMPGECLEQCGTWAAILAMSR